MKLVVVVPTYNERQNIGPLIEALENAFTHIHHACGLLVVDDSSPDGTAEVVRALQKRFPNVELMLGTKQGLGVAYSRGLRYALDAMHAGIVAHMDADFSHDPADLPRLVERIDAGYELVVGARYIDGGGLPDDWGVKRRIISRLANSGARIIAGITQIHDCTNGYRAYHARVLSEVDLAAAPRGYAVLTYLAYQSLLAGARLDEVPVLFSNRAHGTSKLRFNDVLEFFLNAWWIRYDRRDRFFRYATGGFSSVAANLAAVALLYLGFGFAPLLSSGLAIEATVLYSVAWRRAWGLALGRRAAEEPLPVLVRTHLLAVPSAALTFAVFVWATRAGVPVLAAQALGIVPALIWNYFIGDRGLDLLRSWRIVKGGEARAGIGKHESDANA